MFKHGDIGFGDRVKIVDAESTRQSDHVNLHGTCFGLTTPSVTATEFIGDTTEDAAFNVHFDADEIPDAWFAPDLVQLVDHAAGLTATIGSHSFVKDPDGGWIAQQTAAEVDERPSQRRRWFRRS